MPVEENRSMNVEQQRRNRYHCEMTIETNRMKKRKDSMSNHLERCCRYFEQTTKHMNNIMNVNKAKELLIDNNRGRMDNEVRDPSMMKKMRIINSREEKRSEEKENK